MVALHQKTPVQFSTFIPMRKFQFIFAGLAVVLFLGCSHTNKVGLKENWVDERDIMALMSTPINEWMQSVGRPTLVEINGDTSIYYYNYRPTLYKAVAYADGQAAEAKPALANSTEVWGSRKNLMQIKVVQNTVATAMVVAGPDKKVYIRDLNGNLVLDPKSGFTPDFSQEVKVKGDFDEFIKEYSSLNAKNQSVPAGNAVPAVPVSAPAEPASAAPAPASMFAPADAVPEAFVPETLEPAPEAPLVPAAAAPTPSAPPPAPWISAPK